MESPTIKHADCIRTCIRLLEGRLEFAVEPQIKKGLQKDVDTMTELHKIIIQIIENPTLPFLSSYDDPGAPMFDHITQAQHPGDGE